MTAVLPMTHGYVRLPSMRAVAITISVLIHALLFIGYGGSISAPSSESPSTSVTRLNFPAPAPMPAEMPQEPQKAEEPEKEVVKEVPEKPPELARKVIKKKKEVVKAKPEVKPMQQAASAHAESTPQINEGVIQRETERYLSSVMAHIEKHKWYPKAARRRGIEGEISVRFMLLPDGSAVGVVAENGPPLLVSAARQAVETAVPLPKPPATVHCPLECEFRMRFSLNAS